jgi:hypothetical protein
MPVYVSKPALMSAELPRWHLSGRVDGTRWFTRCGRVIAEWPADGSRPMWHLVAIRRLFAGTFAIQCLTCKRAALSGGRS